MRELQEGTVQDKTADDPALAFAAFTLTHAPCGDDLVEVRLGERWLLEWCPSCAALGTFVSPGE